jgi:hypothetical protein
MAASQASGPHVLKHAPFRPSPAEAILRLFAAILGFGRRRPVLEIHHSRPGLT